MRTLLEDIRAELGTDRYKAWASQHPTDDHKVHLELGGSERPESHDSYGRIVIHAIREALAQQPPAPALPSLLELGRNVMFTAWDPARALRCPPHWKVAVSADPAFEDAVRAAAPALKNRGLLAVWGVQTQVGADRIRTLASNIGADYVIFQAETVEEFETAVSAGATLIVGNPNSWTDEQRDYAQSRGDTLATLFEVYANAGSPWPDTASSRGVPVSCEVLGVGWGKTPYQLADYKPHTPAGVWATMSVYLAENMDEQSWGLLP